MRFSMRQDLAVEKIASIGMGFILKSIPVVIALLLVIYKFNIFPQITPFMWFAFFYYLFYVLNQYFIQLAKGCEKVKDTAIAGIISTVTMVAFNVIFLLVIKLGLFGFFLANTLSQALSVFYFAIRLKIFNFVKFNVKDKALKKEMLQYCVPLITVALSWWVNSSASKYIVSAICGVAVNGIFAVAQKIPTILSTIHHVFAQAWNLSAIKEFDKEDKGGFFANTYSMYNAALVLMCSGVIFVNVFLAKILFAKDFFIAWQSSSILVISVLFTALSGFVGSVFTAVKNSRIFSVSTVAAALVNVVLNYLFIPVWGARGGAIATAISFFVVWVIRLICSRKYIKWKINLKADVLAYLLLILQVVFESMEGHMYIGQVCVVFVLIVIYRKQILKIINPVLKKLKTIKKV